MTPSCRADRRSIDRYFAARARPAEAGPLFAHLPECADCRRYFERRQLLASLDRGAPAARERLQRGLGLAPLSRRTLGWASASLVAAAAALVLWMHPVDSGFTARGPDLKSDLQVYRLSPPNGAWQRLSSGGRIGAGDDLAFSYSNPERYQYLMVFAVDENGRVYWYHPAWTDADADPAATPIAPTTMPRELGEAIHQSFSGRHLTLYGRFSHRAPTVRTVEAQLATHALPDDGRVVQLSLEVAR